MRMTLLRAGLAVALAALPVAAATPASAVPEPSPDVATDAATDAASTAAPGTGGLARTSASAAPRTATSGPLRAAVIAPLALPPAAGPLVGAEDLELFTSQGGLLDRQLDALAGESVAIGVDPRIIASIRVLGTAAPESAGLWLRRLELVPNETFALAYADADVVAVSQAGGGPVPEPLDFSYAVDPARFAAPEAPETEEEPDPSSTPIDPEVPEEPDAGEQRPLPTTVDEVLGWNYTIDKLAWPADGTVVADDLAPLADADYDTVVLSSSNVDGADSVHVDLGNSLEGLVVDDGLSEWLRSAAYADTDAEAASSRVGFTRALSRAATATPGRNVLLALDRTWPLPEDLRIDDALSAIQGSSAVTPVTVDALLSGRPGDARIADAPESEQRIGLVERLLEAEAADTRYATIAADPLQITGERRLELLAALSTTWLRNETDWPAAVRAYRVQSRELRAGVQVAEGDDLLALGAEARLPITVSNALDVPVTVYATATPLRPILSVENSSQPIEIVVQPDSSATQYVPAQALANGRVSVRVTLAGANGEQIGATGDLRLDLQAGWETVGTLVAVILVVLVFGFGIVRNILKRRHGRPAGDAEPAPADAAGD